MIGCLNFFLSCPLYFFPCSHLSYYSLRMFLYFISLLLFPFASVWENIRAWVLHFLLLYWMVPSFFARRHSPCFGRSYAYQNFIILLLLSKLMPFFFLYRISLLMLYARMFRKTLVHELPISYRHNEWYFLFPTVQLQEHNEYQVRYYRNTNVLVNQWD